MNRRTNYGNELTLLELIIVIGLFAVFMVVNLRIFASAHKISKDSDRLSHAIVAAENAAECFKAGLEPTLFYDESWLPTEENRVEYVLALEESYQNDVSTAEITVTDKNDGEIFNLKVKVPTEVLP